ncbi:hypothetical protein V6Z12_A01G098600 [Gossypium hirsutum]
MTETVKTSNTGEGSEISVNNSNPMSEFQNIKVAYRLNGKNYLKWSQLVRTFLKGRGKLSHLLGTRPKEGDPKFDAWDEQDPTFDAVRVQILGKEELPSLNETIAIVRAEEGKREVMVENNQVDSSALVTNAVNERRFGLEQLFSEDNRQIERTKSFNKDSAWCTYCKKARHTKDRCWKLHGKPQTTNKNFSEKGGQSKGQG